MEPHLKPLHQDQHQPARHFAPPSCTPCSLEICGHFHSTGAAPPSRILCLTFSACGIQPKGEVRRNWPRDPPSWLPHNSNPYGVMQGGCGVSGQRLTNGRVLGDLRGSSDHLSLLTIHFPAPDRSGLRPGMQGVPKLWTVTDQQVISVLELGLGYTRWGGGLYEPQEGFHLLGGSAAHGVLMEPGPGASGSLNMFSGQRELNQWPGDN